MNSQNLQYFQRKFLTIYFVVLLVSVSYAQQSNFFNYLPGRQLISFETTRDGGYIVNTWASNYLVTKLDSTGQVEWNYFNNQSNGVDSVNVLSDLKQTLDDGYLGVGSITYHGNDFDLIAIKFDKFGNVEWKNKFDVYFFDSFSNLIVESDTTYLVSGFFMDTNSSTNYGFITKLNSQGDTLWVKKYIPAVVLFGEPEYIKRVGNNYYLFGEWSNGISPNFMIQKIMKMDTLGNIQAIYPINDTASLALPYWKYWSVNDSIFHSYRGMQTSSGNYFYQITEFDLNGNKKSSNVSPLELANFDSDSTLIGMRFESSLADSIFIMGAKYNSGTTHNYGYLFKTHSSPFDEFVDFKRDKYNNVIVGGSYDPLGFGAQPYLARFVDTSFTAGLRINEKTNDEFIIFPNPSKDIITIKPPLSFHLFGRAYTYSLFDLMGRKVKSSQETINCGITISLSFLPSGLYFLKLASENKVISISKIIIN